METTLPNPETGCQKRKLIAWNLIGMVLIVLFIATWQPLLKLPAAFTDSMTPFWFWLQEAHPIALPAVLTQLALCLSMTAIELNSKKKSKWWDAGLRIIIVAGLWAFSLAALYWVMLPY